MMNANPHTSGQSRSIERDGYWCVAFQAKNVTPAEALGL